MNLIEAIDDPALFGGMIERPSWKPWRAFLTALAAMPMDGDALALYRRHTGRQTPPVRPARYAELVVGRRGGKSRVLGIVAAFLAAIPDHSKHVVPGETPVVAVIAKDRPQARIVLSYILGTLRASPLLAPLIADDATESVRLTNGVTIEVHTASIGAPRGRTYIAVLCDEIAFWPTGDSANPDVEVINAVRPGLSTIPYSLLLIASSPYAKRGILYQNYAKYFGKDDAPVLVWQGSTTEMNATLADDPLIEEMAAEDPERAAAEHGAQFRSDIVAFITREAIEDCLARGVRELPPGGGIDYFGFVDPSGGSADSFTLAVAHVDPDGVAILDCIREVKPPFSPDAVVQEYAELLKSYRIATITGDAYAGEWPRERFAMHGITYQVSRKPKSAIYGEFLPSLNGRRVQLLDLPRLVGQLAGLERRTARGGRDSIDHGPGQHDDVANSACGALVHVLTEKRPSLIKSADLIPEQPAVLAFPAMYFAVVWVGIDGMASWVACGYSERGGAKLLIEDFGTQPWRHDLLHTIATALDGLCEAGYGRERHPDGREIHVFLHVQGQLEALAQDAMIQVFSRRLDLFNPGRRIIAANVIDPLVVADPARLTLNAAASISGGMVKLGAEALAKSAVTPILGSLTIRPGEDVTADSLRIALLVALAELDAAPSVTAGAPLRFG